EPRRSARLLALARARQHAGRRSPAAGRGLRRPPEAGGIGRPGRPPPRPLRRDHRAAEKPGLPARGVRRAVVRGARLRTGPGRPGEPAFRPADSPAVEGPATPASAAYPT